MAKYQSVFDLPDPLSGSGSSWQNWANEIDPGNERASWSSWAAPEMFTYGSTAGGDVFYDPYSGGESYAPESSVFGHQQTTAAIDAWMQERYPELYTFADPDMPTNPGQVGNPGTGWAAVNSWNKDVVAVAKQVQQETGVYVPPNVIKAIMKIESGGQFNTGQGAESPAGARGLLQVTSMSMGTYDRDRLLTDPVYGIYAGTKDLALRYQHAKSINPEYTWSNVAVGFFSGHYEPIGSEDDYNTDYNYMKMFDENMQTLVASGGTPAPGPVGTGDPDMPMTPTPTGSGNQIKAIWGDFDAPISQEYGWTDFARQSGSYYDYGAIYTRDGRPMGHPGLDVGLAINTKLYAPLDAVVILNGGTTYYCDNDDGGNGCGYGVGELRLLVNGSDELIIGHMRQITVKPGDVIRAGDFVGYSGSENGAHMHLEYRRWVGKPTTSSGFEVVDPRLALTGVFTGTYGDAPGTSAGISASANDWQSFMKSGALGLPLRGGFQGGWTQWLRGAMQGTNEREHGDLGWFFGDTPTTPTTPATGSGGTLEQ